MNFDVDCGGVIYFCYIHKDVVEVRYYLPESIDNVITASVLGVKNSTKYWNEVSLPKPVKSLIERYVGLLVFS